MGTLLIRVTKDPDGLVFVMDGKSRQVVSDLIKPLRIPRKLFISYESEQDFGDHHGPFYDQAALLLTGLSRAQLAELGGAQFVDALTDRPIYRARFQTKEPETAR